MRVDERSDGPGPAVVLVAILMLALAVRLVGLPGESLDGDEIFTLQVATAPTVPEAISLVAADLVHPPLYYLVARVTVALFGGSDLALRLPSLVFGLLSIALIRPLGRRLGAPPAVVLLAATLVAVHHWHVFYSQQARAYALFCLLTMLLLLWAARAGSGTVTRSRLLAGFALAALLVYTHYVGAVFVAAIAVALAVRESSAARRWREPAALVLGALTLAPWLIALRPAYRLKQGLESNLGWVGAPSWADARDLWGWMLGLPDFPRATTASIALTTLFVACALPGAWRRLAPLVAAGVAVPLVVVALAMSPARLPVFGIRHVLPAVAPFLLLTALGLVRLASRARRRRAVLAAGASVLVFFAAASSWQYRGGGPVRFPYARIAAEVSEPPLASLPLYSTWEYGIARPLRRYLPPGRVVLPLVGAPSGRPPEILVVHRPDVRRERELVDALRREGYQAEERRPYRSGAGTWGHPELIRLVRRPPAPVPPAPAAPPPPGPAAPRTPPSRPAD